MKKLLMGLLLIVLCGIGTYADSATPSKIIGLASECPTSSAGCLSIPLTITQLCTVSCPFRSSFSFTDANRFWGASGSGTGSCITSTDGGTTWGACTSQPFTTGANELYAGASDGSVIAVGTPTGPNTCTVRRSINNATSWTTTFTQVFNCNAGNSEGQRLFCLSDGRCLFVNGASGASQVFRSSDNGQNWIAGETGIAPNCGNMGIAWNGDVGIAGSQAPGCGGGGVARTFVTTGGLWGDSTTWNGTQGDCWGNVIYNGVGYVVCQGAGATPDGRYTLRTSVSTNFASLTLPNALITSIDTGGVAISIATDNLYVFAVSTLDSRAHAYVSRDGAASFGDLGAIWLSGMRGGNAFFANGCIYVTGGTSLRFSKIC